MPPETEPLKPSGPHPELPETGEKQLCVSCAVPNEPSAHFCAKCGAPLTSYASTGPFESIFAEGSVYRSAAERPQKLVVFLGMWLIFGLTALIGVIFIATMRESGFIFGVIGAGMAAI